MCDVCGRRYTNKRTMRAHMKLHQGLTTCRICLKVICTVEHLRRHLLAEHALSADEVRLLTTPPAHRQDAMPPVPYTAAAQLPAPGTAGAGGGQRRWSQEPVSESSSETPLRPVEGHDLGGWAHGHPKAEPQE